MTKFDPTTNRAPWCLLTEDEKAAMMAAKHGWLWLDLPSSWYPTDDPVWRWNTIYRAKPAPEEEPASVDWSHVSKDVVAMAMDEDGTWYSYGRIPFCGAKYWHPGGRSVGFATAFASFNPGTVTDWRKTLIVRPGYEGEGDD